MVRSEAEIREQLAAVAALLRPPCLLPDDAMDGLIAAQHVLSWLLGEGEDHEASPVEFNLPQVPSTVRLDDLTADQLDGLACITCNRDARQSGAMLPLFAGELTLFTCAAHARGPFVAAVVAS